MASRATNPARLRALAEISDEVESIDAMMLELLIRGHVELMSDIEQGAVLLASERIDELEATLTGRLAQMMKDGRSDRSISELNKRIDQVKAIRSRGFGDLVEILERSTLAAAKHESAKIAATMRALADEAPILTGFNILSPAQLRQVSKRDFLGADVRRWVRARDITGQLTMERELRASFFAGEGVDGAARRVMRVLSTDRHEAETITRTVIQGAANEAAIDTYQANADVLSGMRHVATLDDRVCEECVGLDGTIYALDDAPMMPVHPNCRCFLSPVVKGFERADIPKGAEWIRRQPQWIQDKVLGTKRKAA